MLHLLLLQRWQQFVCVCVVTPWCLSVKIHLPTIKF